MKKKEKRDGRRPRKEKEKKKKNKAEGLSKKEKHKVLKYAKGIRVKKKFERSTKCLKKRDVACSLDLDLL